MGDGGTTEANGRVARWATAFERWDQWRGMDNGTSEREKMLFEEFLAACRDLHESADKADILSDEDLDMAAEEAKFEERARVLKLSVVAERKLDEARRTLRTVADALRLIDDPDAAKEEEVISEADQFGGKLPSVAKFGQPVARPPTTTASGQPIGARKIAAK